VAFGNQRTGTSSAVTNVTVTNSGTATLNITGITLTGTNPGDFSLGAPTAGTACPLGASSLNAGSNCAVGVTFKPTVTGARSASVSVADNASGSPQTVPLTGTGTASAVTFTPVNVAFGNQRTGTMSATTNVTITNSGTATLNITSITLTGTNTGDFTLGAPTTGTACALGANSLNVSSSCAVGVTFKPTATGARSANISVADDAPASPQTVPLTGTGTASAVTLAPTTVPFGNQVVSTQSAVTNVMITNSGTATLNITGITLTGTNPGDFSLGAPTAGTACALGANSLNAGSNCSFGVSFGPTATGARSASVSIADDASGSPQTVALTGTGTAANVTLAPSPVNFSNQRINTTSGTTTVTLSNSGNAAVTLSASSAVTITGTNPGDFAIVAAAGTNCANGLVVAATNGTCVIGVTFKPTTTGARTATLQVSDNATPGTQSITLNGTGTTPTASVAPPNIPFGNQRKGTTSAGTDVTVSNTGTDTLNIASIALTGANANQFTLGAPSSGTACSLAAATPVAAGANCKFSVKFGPTATGVQNASVTITDDSGAVAGTVQTVTLSGTGTLPQASAAPNPLPFGNVRKGTTSGALTVTLTNTGTDTLNLAAANAVTISGANAADFAIVSGTTTCKNSTAVPPAPGPGNTCVVNIAFTPSTSAAEAATLTFTDDSGGVAGTQQVVNLTGTGVLPQGGAAPSTLPFGNQPKGVTSAPQTVTLTNSGTDTLHLAAANAVAISGANAGDFAVVLGTTCTNAAAVAPAPGPGNTCVINVTFTPSTTAAEAATLTITDDSGGTAGTTQTVSLTGTGTTVTVALSPSPENFNNQRQGTTSSAQTITLTNSGNGSVTLAAANAVALSGANAADFAITGGTCANNLVVAAAPGPGNTCTITVTFTPSTAAAETATVTVSFQGGTPPAPDALNGTGIFPAVTLTPNTPLAFGNQIITTTSATQTVVLKNTGTDTLNLAGVNAVALGGTNAAEFTTAGTTCTNSQAIPVNGTCNIVVAFSPATAGVKAATVTITDDVSTAQAINLSGTGVTPPTAGLSAATLTFAAQRTATTSAAQTETITNNGGADLNIATVALAGTNASDFTIATGTTCTNSSMVKGGAANTCVINVTFTPSAVGARTATITITDNADATGAPGAAQTITLNGTGKAPAITLAPSPVPNFGNQRIGTVSGATTVTITNSGTDTLNFTSITITGANAGDFTVAGSGATPCPTGAGSLNATLSCTIGITFKPTATGARSASVTVTDDASNSPQSLALAGTGTAPAVMLSTNAITFPTTAVNSTSAPQSATVTNSGTATLTLGATAVAISGANAGDFAVAAGTTCTNGAAVAVSASCTINFTFKPTAAGIRNATATITDDAGGAPGSSTTQTITLSGATPSTAALSTANINFGNQGVSVASSAQTITITNNGGAKLNLAAANAVAVSGTNSGDFAVSSGTTCTNGASVSGSGGTCVINLTFTPGAIGARGPATVTITDDAGGVANSTQTATLNGTGIDFTFTATGASQTVKAGSPATFTFTVSPGGGSFPNAITFTTSALPRGAKAAFNPPNLTAPVTTQQTVTLSISTTSRGAAPLPSAPRVPPLLIFRFLTVLFAFLALLIIRRGLRTRRLLAYVPLLLILVALAVSAGCAGNSNGTPAGTTQVTVTATAGSLSHTTTVSLTVN